MFPDVLFIWTGVSWGFPHNWQGDALARVNGKEHNGCFLLNVGDQLLVLDDVVADNIEIVSEGSNNDFSVIEVLALTVSELLDVIHEKV